MNRFHIDSLGREAGWSNWKTRQTHDLKTAGSNPAPATNEIQQVWNAVLRHIQFMKLRGMSRLIEIGFE